MANPEKKTPSDLKRRKKKLIKKKEPAILIRLTNVLLVYLRPL
jgi:hypothetical protein